MAGNAIHPSGGWRTARLAAGLLTAGGVAALIAALFVAMGMGAATTPVTGSAASLPGLAHLLRMTAIQAGLSTVLSLGVGTTLAWALDRLSFPGRGIVVGLFSASLVLPTLVIVSGLLSVWGRNGWVNRTLEALTGHGIGSVVFGLGGILAAHVILNGAYAARVLLTRIEAIPATKLKLGQGLGLGARTRFAVLDWRVIRDSLPGLAATIFLLCFTSFAIVLVLGGGPANQTFEVAIYSSVRLDFDLGGAVRLALVQLLACTLIILPASSLSPSTALAGATLPQRWHDGRRARTLQILVLALGTFGFVLPLLGIAADGVGGLGHLVTEGAFWRALRTSFMIGCLSALLTLALALILTMARANARNAIVRAVINLPVFTYLAVPAVVLSLGFFLLARQAGLDAQFVAPAVLVTANALLALPFAVTTLGPPLAAIDLRYMRLSRSLGLGGLSQWRHVEWPLLRREVGVVLALGFCFSLGDLGVISLFGTQDFSTLPWLMLRALGAYRSNDAGAIGLILLLISLTAFTLIPYLVARKR